MTTRTDSVLAWMKVVILVGMFAAGALLYGRLPEQIPSHWGFTGEANDYMGKPWGVWLMPLVALAMAVLFPLFQRIDPKRENYEEFRHAWNIFQLVLVAFFAYIYGMQLYLSLNALPSPDFVGRYVTFGIGILFIVIGNYMGKIRQNFFVGLRTPWSLSDPQTWSKSQRFGGRAFVLGGLVTLAESAIWWHPEIVFFGTVLLVSLVPIVYSYLIFPGKKPSAKGTKSFLILILAVMLIAAGTAAVMRLASSEDDWICNQGQWVKHGNPSAPQPTTSCP